MPPAETPRTLDVAGAGMAFALYCRAGVHARRTDKIFKIFQCAAGPRPRPTERRERAVFPGTPRGEHPCREAYMPPLQMRYTRLRIKYVATGQTPTGRMHAAPTNTRYRVREPGDGWRRKVYGPHACGPYEPAGNVRRMGKAGVYRVPSTAGSRPRPTNRGKRATNREPRAGHTPAGRHVCLPYKSGHRVRKPKTLP